MLLVERAGERSRGNAACHLQFEQFLVHGFDFLKQLILFHQLLEREFLLFEDVADRAGRIENRQESVFSITMHHLPRHGEERGALRPY